MVKSGIWNSFPYVSNSFPVPFFRSSPPSESRDDNDVDDSECRGESIGEADVELEDEEGADSVSTVRFKAVLRVMIGSDMLQTLARLEI